MGWGFEIVLPIDAAAGANYPNRECLQSAVDIGAWTSSWPPSTCAGWVPLAPSHPSSPSTAIIIANPLLIRIDSGQSNVDLWIARIKISWSKLKMQERACEAVTVESRDISV